ncbi:photosynthetic reaction center cytochrome PufC [Thiorhodospira sibirica]|uniref:photosynthetic reaction center cytochrome PufC n=2 Tax=Thiorhodospira sibirica TaxID=154347 RepID=UPI00022C1D17|nr:photosynthetic reaction center cytochrome PufC [Thiorhodospira sibirica]
MKSLRNKLMPLIAAGAAVALLSGCEVPIGMEAEQIGYRGTGMEEVNNPRLQAKLLEANQIPEPQPPASQSGPKAGDVYENVKVLGDLSVAEFNRLMNAITEWVAPVEGCHYCHDGDNWAAEAPYTKMVSREMLKLTRHINSQWTSHVAQTGVTCYTCHRGNPIPENTWRTHGEPPQAGGFAANRYGMNLGSASVMYASLPYDPFTPFLKGDKDIPIVPLEALPQRLGEGEQRVSFMDTYQTYGLMMHISGALGVNCTYCHNSRSFLTEETTPKHSLALIGIRMARDINTSQLEPMAGLYPEEVLAAHGGEVAKVNCLSCHQGVFKPLYGQSMLKDYKGLN